MNLPRCPFCGRAFHLAQVRRHISLCRVCPRCKSKVSGWSEHVRRCRA